MYGRSILLLLYAITTSVVTASWRTNTEASISVNGSARGKIQMQFFSIPVEDGFLDANLTVRDGLRQAAARDTNLIYQ